MVKKKSNGLLQYIQMKINDSHILTERVNIRFTPSQYETLGNMSFKIYYKTGISTLIRDTCEKHFFKIGILPKNKKSETFSINIRVRFTQEQITVIDRHSLKYYGKIRRATLIREICLSHLFKT